MRAGLRVVIACLSAAPAFAGESPALDGLTVGTMAAGGEVAGGLVLGAAGVGLGAMACRDRFECYTPLLGGIVGAGVGVGVGAPVGGAIGAGIVDVRAGRVAGFALIAEGAALGFAVAGLVSENETLLASAPWVAVIGAPIAAGIGAATDPGRAASPPVSVAPFTSGRQHGLVVSGRF